ncbi:hypothetical protein F4X73_08205 [Candidatus Poribacteria bacterium]|nr:hypothetical protein [Candidatus Poribacteria bacterium]MYF55674.1 hypothetical protein [Candidatus Poribacteria bacterium]
MVVMSAVFISRIISSLTQSSNVPPGVSTVSTSTTVIVLVVVAVPTKLSSVTVTSCQVRPSGNSAGKKSAGGSRIAAAMPNAPSSKCVRCSNRSPLSSEI